MVSALAAGFSVGFSVGLAVDLAVGLPEEIRPFFFRVRRAEVETLHLTFWPLITSVRLETLGLKTLRV